jgi:Ubiquitin carboxyl-terminal hydrolase
MEGTGTNLGDYIDDDQVMIEDDQSGGKAQFEGDSYKVTHKGEKFALIPGGAAQNKDIQLAKVPSLQDEER